MIQNILCFYLVSFRKHFLNKFVNKFYNEFIMRNSYSFIFFNVFFLLMTYRSGAGSHYGTFSGPVKTFSPVSKQKNAYASPGRNFITNPSRKGTGYGYVNVLIGKAQQYASEPYDRAREIRRVSFKLFLNKFTTCQDKLVLFYYSSSADWFCIWTANPSWCWKKHFQKERVV